MSTFDIKFKQDYVMTASIDAKDDTEALTIFFEIYPKATVCGISEVITVSTPKGTHDYV